MTGTASENKPSNHLNGFGANDESSFEALRIALLNKYYTTHTNWHIFHKFYGLSRTYEQFSNDSLAVTV